MNLQSAYQYKKVFITGHTGFKGAWLTKWLHILGAHIKGYALAPKNQEDIFVQIHNQKNCESVINDIRDIKSLKKEIINFAPDFIFHLAAQPLVRYSYQEPIETFQTNVIGTANVLEALRELKNPCIAVMITTDKVYHNYEWVYPYREVDQLGGHDPYSASKACAELVVNSYRNSFFNINAYDVHHKSIAVGRAGNVIGGGDWCKDRLLPDIVKALAKNQDIIIRNPKSIRPWQHVLEPLSGYLILGANIQSYPLQYGTAYNFGPYMEDTLNVEQVVQEAIKIWGHGNMVVPHAEVQPHEAAILKLDINKATSELHWKPKTNARQAIDMTIQWYKKYIDGTTNMDHFTISQIEKYINDYKNE